MLRPVPPWRVASTDGLAAGALAAYEVYGNGRGPRFPPRRGSRCAASSQRTGASTGVRTAQGPPRSNRPGAGPGRPQGPPARARRRGAQRLRYLAGLQGTRPPWPTPASATLAVPLGCSPDGSRCRRSTKAARASVSGLWRPAKQPGAGKPERQPENYVDGLRRPAELMFQDLWCQSFVAGGLGRADHMGDYQ